MPNEIVLFNASGDRDGYVNRKRAERLVAEGQARWIHQGNGRKCLRRTAESITPTSRTRAGVTARDMQVLAGAVGSQAEQFVVRERICEAWAPK